MVITYEDKLDEILDKTKKKAKKVRDDLADKANKFIDEQKDMLDLEQEKNRLETIIGLIGDRDKVDFYNSAIGELIEYEIVNMKGNGEKITGEEMIIEWDDSKKGYETPDGKKHKHHFPDKDACVHYIEGAITEISMLDKRYPGMMKDLSEIKYKLIQDGDLEKTIDDLEDVKKELNLERDVYLKKLDKKSVKQKTKNFFKKIWK